MKKTVSIIIRTRNEERWISSCLESVFSQEFKDFEVIIVDNDSVDNTVEKAKQFEIADILNISEYLPGKALNLGVKASSGKYFVCLSGHCIPVNNYWLGNLVDNIELPDVAGVYGRQQPLSYSSDFDKRDLLITFGLDRKVQVKDSFFHNANSIIKKSIWEKIPFDNEITNIEDRIWAKEVIRRGYKIIYEPNASVYHYHGIHQNSNAERCQEIVQILEKLEYDEIQNSVDLNKVNVISIIPVKGDIGCLGRRLLLEYTVERSKQSKHIKYTVVASDNSKTLDLAKKLDVDFCLKRPDELSRDYIDIQDILKFSIDELENLGIFSDIVVYMSINCPFRKNELLDSMIEQLIHGGFDSIIPANPEFKSCWIDEGGVLKRIDQGFMPSKLKQPIHVGISGLGTVTYVDIIRRGDRLGEKVGMYELNDIVCSIDVGKQSGLNLAEMIIDKWWEENL